MVFDFERAAMKGAEMPDGLDLPDQLAFLALRTLYAQYHDGKIDRETARAEKGRIAYRRDTWARALGNAQERARSSAELYRRAEGAANRYAKERTLENADALYKAVYGVTVEK